MTGMNGCFGKSLDLPGGGAYGNAILSRAPLRSARTVRLPGGGEPRTILRCESQWDAIEVPLLTTHLAAWDIANRGPRGAQVAIDRRPPRRATRIRSRSSAATSTRRSSRRRCCRCASARRCGRRPSRGWSPTAAPAAATTTSSSGSGWSVERRYRRARRPLRSLAGDHHAPSRRPPRGGRGLKRARRSRTSAAAPNDDRRSRPRSRRRSSTACSPSSADPDAADVVDSQPSVVRARGRAPRDARRGAALDRGAHARLVDQRQPGRDRAGRRVLRPAAARSRSAPRRPIHIETYVWWTGDICRRVAELLAAKAKEGVEVRLLLDWAGAPAARAETCER